MEYSIVRVVWEFPPLVGGSITHIVELSRAINPYLKDQKIIAPDFDGFEQFDKNFSIPVIRIPYSRVYSFYYLPSLIQLFYARSVVIRLIDLIKDGHEIDIIHVHGAMLGSFVKLFMNFFSISKPVVIMQHGYGSERIIGQVLSRILALRLIKISHPEFVILLNDGTPIFKISDYLNKCNINNDTVYHGINTDFFAPKTDRASSRDFYILFPHRPVEFKRPDLAIEIFRKYLDLTSSKNSYLILLGINVKNHDLVESINESNVLKKYVILKGEQNLTEMDKIINMSDAVIGTSLESNMNRAILESMASEKAVVVFSCGGINNLLKNKQNGILIDPGDTTAFAKMLALLYKDSELRTYLGSNARKTILSERSWSSRIDRELKFYRYIRP